MKSSKLNTLYKPAIGIECHVQLNTKTKLFAAVSNDARSAEPNTLVSHICFGLPGALPVLNEKALELACIMGFALNARPQKQSIFERKHYFYPDLPKGYQITQLSQPIIKGGYVEIASGGQAKKIRINRVQIEEDAGKNTHPAGADYSLVDLNRAGTPLLEIVSEPDISNSTEAKAYVRELYLLAIYAGVSDADLYHGNMRFDVNVSVSKSNELGTRSETKNLNSFRSVEKAVQYEIKRQTELLEKGQTVVQETRGWDDAKQKTFSQRGKEEAHDYRYMPEPDIPPIVLTDSEIDAIKAKVPVTAGKLRNELIDLDVDEQAVEILLFNKNYAVFVHAIATNHGHEHAKRVANWLVNAAPHESQVPDGEISEVPFKVNEQSAVKLSQMVASSELSSTAAKEIWLVLMHSGGDPLIIAKERNLLQQSNEAELEQIIDDVIAANKKAADDVRAGQDKAIGFLVGQVMSRSGGKANPGLARKLMIDRLKA